MSIIPPASATLIWAFPTPHEEVRCFVWEHSPVGWVIAIMFGEETMAIETAPTRRAMQAGVDMVWRGLLASGFGKRAAEHENKAIAAMSEPAPEVERPHRVEAPGQSHHSGQSHTPVQSHPSGQSHTPFRHHEPPDDDVESSRPTPRRRPH